MVVKDILQDHFKIRYIGCQISFTGALYFIYLNELIPFVPLKMNNLIDNSFFIV